MYLIDTDIVIYALKSDPNVVSHFQEKANCPKTISVITYGELYFGAMKSQSPQKNLIKVRRVTELFPIIEVSRSIAETFASLKANLLSRGKPLDDFDLLIAATALNMNYCLITNNERHFQRIDDLRIENWSKPRK